jgi:endonuclease/exonuclease/phosphatase family metal-dependent hydrolase
VRVATLNLWGRSGDWTARRAVLARGFEELAPDLVLLQEVADGQEQEVLGPGYEVVHHDWTAVASRRSPGRTHVLGGEQGQAATLLVEFDDLVAVNHFPSWAPSLEAARERETVAAARRVEELVGDRHVILGGDLDAVPDAASIRFLRGLQGLDGFSVRYLDAWEAVHPGDPGHTFTTVNPLVMEESSVTREEPRRIDYLFMRCTDDGPTLAVRDCRLMFTDPVGSDHYGLLADLTPYR